MSHPELDGRIQEFVVAADEVRAAYWKDQGYTNTTPPTHRADYISDKWARVVVIEDRGGKPTVTSVYAFIALRDGETKGLGKVLAGGIHKPASFKAPAKHQRGNIFDQDFRKALTAFGIVYLR